MIRGLYTSATGMMVQRNRMDVLTNNIVNIETTGYKKDTLLTMPFDEVMLQRKNDPNVNIYGGNLVGPYSFGTHVDELVTNFSQGSLEQTGRTTDLAIAGEGFFVIETPAGERYTRAGNFAVDSEGYLVTGDGNYVLGENGRIYVGSTDFTVSADGTITGELAEPNRLRIVTFEDAGVLRKEGSTLYSVYGGAQPVEAQGYSVKQGMQESSNVDAASEMVEMISLYRKYEANQRALKMNDETLGMAVKLGSING